jgi:hypothetical protein
MTETRNPHWMIMVKEKYAMTAIYSAGLRPEREIGMAMYNQEDYGWWYLSVAKWGSASTRRKF